MYPFRNIERMKFRHRARENVCPATSARCRFCGALQQCNLSLVVGVMLEEPTDQRADGDASAGGRIALVADPANEVVGVQGFDRSLQLFLRSREILLCGEPC